MLPSRSSSGPGPADLGGAGSAQQAKIVAQLTEFKRDTRHNSFEYPVSTSSFDRRLVHETATKLGLQHSSRGQGPQRRLVVWKTGPEPGLVKHEPPGLGDTQPAKRAATAAKNVHTS